jgi:hypothetical protein
VKILGRIDLTTETSMLAAHMAMPREGHLISVLRIFSYLKKHQNARIALRLIIASSSVERWFYNNVEEPIPPNASTPPGKPLVIRFYVDADDAGDQVTRRSRTGFIKTVL